MSTAMRLTATAAALTAALLLAGCASAPGAQVSASPTPRGSATAPTSPSPVVRPSPSPTGTPTPTPATPAPAPSETGDGPTRTLFTAADAAAACVAEHAAQDTGTRITGEPTAYDRADDPAWWVLIPGEDADGEVAIHCWVGFTDDGDGLTARYAEVDQALVDDEFIRAAVEDDPRY